MRRTERVYNNKKSALPTSNIVQQFAYEILRWDQEISVGMMLLSCSMPAIDVLCECNLPIHNSHALTLRSNSSVLSSSKHVL